MGPTGFGDPVAAVVEELEWTGGVRKVQGLFRHVVRALVNRLQLVFAERCSVRPVAVSMRRSEAAMSSVCYGERVEETVLVPVEWALAGRSVKPEEVVERLAQRSNSSLRAGLTFDSHHGWCFRLVRNHVLDRQIWSRWLQLEEIAES